MIRVQDLGKRYGGVRALDGVSFEAGAGERLALLGPSGSGKTTLLRVVAGLELPDAGQIFIWDRLVSEPGRGVPPHLRGIGFVFQASTLWPHMSVRGNIAYGLAGWPREQMRARLAELIEQMSLQGLESRFPAQLSGGEARRVELARALAPKPSTLLMDEPLTNLDPELKTRLLDLIRGSAEREGATLMYVTHVAEEAESIADRVLQIAQGRLVG
jgi:iron(III) transport system ATP-binding protein